MSSFKPGCVTEAKLEEYIIIEIPQYDKNMDYVKYNTIDLESYPPYYIYKNYNKYNNTKDNYYTNNIV